MSEWWQRKYPGLDYDEVERILRAEDAGSVSAGGSDGDGADVGGDRDSA